MKLFLINREQIQSIGSFLVSELDSLVARIRGSWNVEHNEDDSHGHVHADSVASGRLTFSDIATATISESQVVNFAPAGLSTASMLRLESSLAFASITGIKVPQDENGAVLDGRVLVIENTTTSTVVALEAEDTSSSPRNRIITPWGPPSTELDPLRLYLRPSSLTTLIYNAKKARWIVLGQANDNSVQHSTFTAARQDNVSTAAIGRARVCRIDTAGVGASISGFDATNIPVTTRLTIVNVGLYKFSLLHQNTNSLAANRIQCPSGIQYVLNPREAVDLYKGDEGWRIVEKAHQWIDVTFDSTIFTASAGTWTLTSADQTTLAYQIDGDDMTVSFELETTSVSTTPTRLSFTIPNSRIAARKMSAPLASVSDNGTKLDTGRAEVTAGGTRIDIYKNAADAAWTASTNLTSVRGQIKFKIRDDDATISESHTDVAHGDTAHSDVDHSDVAHSDVTHGDTHSDSSHTDTAHSDVAHADSTSHSDVAHADVDHSDSAHADVEHVDGAHEDVAHADAHQDDPIGPPPVDRHEDIAHEDSAHGDSAHADTSHSDVAFSDTAHSDSSSHSDTPFSDTAHVDGGHGDSHSDTVPHSDVTHADTSHGDTAHADSLHSDVGYHTDNAHADL